MIPGLGKPLEKEMTTHSSILAWRISWTEKPGRLQSVGSQSQTQLKRLSLAHSKSNNQAQVIQAQLSSRDDLGGGMGSEREVQEGGDICIHIPDPLCCTAETNTIM